MNNSNVTLALLTFPPHEFYFYADGTWDVTFKTERDLLGLDFSTSDRGSPLVMRVDVTSVDVFPLFVEELNRHSYPF